MVRIMLALVRERAQLSLKPEALGRVAHVEHESGHVGIFQAVGRDNLEVGVSPVAAAYS
jgi:hypothetical protein